MPESAMQEPTILVVEAPVVRDTVRVVLERAGFHVLTATPADAKAILESGRVSLLITNRPADLIGGLPDLRVLYTSASPDRDLLKRFPNKTLRVLQKPFLASELLDSVRRLLSRPARGEVKAPGRKQQASLARCPPKHTSETSAAQGQQKRSGIDRR